MMNAICTCKIKISILKNFTFKYIRILGLRMKHISHIISNNLIQILYNSIQNCFLENRKFLENNFMHVIVATNEYLLLLMISIFVKVSLFFGKI